MAARGSGGLLFCVALLLAMPALAATPADRGECAASADKPDVGGAACSRIIDDASVSVAERVKAFKDRGRGAFNGKDYDRAIADYGEAIKLSPGACRRLCAPLRGIREQGGSRRRHCRLHRGDQDRSEIWLGLQQPWRRLLRSA